MGKQGKWSAAVVWLLVIFCGLYTLPTFVGKDALPDWYTDMFSSELSYGLDLQGGLELRYTVDWKTAIRDNGVKLGDSIRQRLVEELAKKDNKALVDLSADERKAYGDKVTIEVPRQEETVIRVGFVDAATRAKVDDDTLTNIDVRYELSAIDDTTFELVLLDDEVALIRDEAVKKTRQLISQRVEAFGLVDPDVRVAGDSDIVVQIPGVGKDQMDTVRQRIGQTAQLTFRVVDDQATFFAEQTAALGTYKAEHPDRADELEIVGTSSTGPYARHPKKSELIRFVRTLDVPPDHVIGYELLTREGDDDIVTERFWRTHYLHANVAVSGAHLARSRVGYNEKNQPVVHLDLNAEGADLFADLSENNIGGYIAIMLDRTVESAPVINERIPGGRVQITMGNQNPQKMLREAQSLSTVLNQGAYQAPVYKVHDHEVGASLGRDSVEAGMWSMGGGSIVVIIFMMIYYGLSGVFAVTALLLNVLLILGLLVSFNSALTLPGIAGIILTIGMAVDANIIVFERIREEIRGGRGPRAAVDTGYARAMSTILDANITTALAGFILLNYTSGPIRGFAVTLLMGIVCSVFTAVYVCHRIFNWYLETRRPETLSIG